MNRTARAVMRWIATVGFVSIGIVHFVSPAGFVAMIPEALPYPEALNYIAGAAEILGGLGLILPATRRLAAWGLIALLVAVFPANINMAVNHLPLGDRPVASWVLWARLPLQVVMVAWVFLFTRPEPT